ncbi:MAG: T9SS type A sorting domain-containing protein [Bacteroidota bacterium]|nr:T9SS type A sorting domain-containing protein [Bacteroidota bacterium]
MKYLISILIGISIGLSSFAQSDAVTIRIGSDEGIKGSEVLIPVTAENFTDILSAQGSIAFNESLLQFIGTENYGLSGMTASSFGTSQTGSGYLTFSWYDASLIGESLTDGTTLFAMRFEVLGSTAQTTPIQLSSDITPVEIVNNLYNTLTVYDQTGQVSILANPNPGVELNIGFSNHSVPVGEEILIPVEVSNFDLITGIQGSITWNPSVISFVSTESYNLSDMGSGNFGINQTASGTLTFSWNDIDLSGETLTDGQSVFSLRFQAVGSTGEQSNLSLGNHPTGLEFTDVSLSSIDYTTIPGTITIENSLPSADVSLLADSVEGGIGAVVQLPVRVSDFSDIISLQGSLSFDSNIAEFDTIIQYGLPSLAYANFGTNNASLGSLSFSWNDPTLAGVTLPSNSAIFVLQFTLIGNISDISPLDFVETPTSLECVKNDFTVLSTSTNPGQLKIIDVYELEITNVSDDEFCAEESFTIQYFAEGNFLPGNTFALELSDNTGDFSSTTVIGSIISTSSGSVNATLPTNLSSGNYQIRLNADMPEYTSDIWATTLTINALPNANAGSDEEICLGNSVTLTATGGTIYSWDNGDNTDAITVNPTVDTEYIVTVEDVFGCQNTDTVQVIVHNLPTAFAGNDQDICLGETITLTATGGVDYEWSNGDMTVSSDITPTTNTEYIVTVTDANTCSNTDTVLVNVFEVIADAGTNEDICEGESLTITATGGTDYAWSSGDNTATTTVNPTADTEYYITVTGVNLCTDIDTVLVNIFTPPGIPELPLGIIDRCSSATTDTFTIPSINNISNYIWETDIIDFGSISSTDTMAIIQWSANFHGELQLFVTVENICGSATSEHLVITTTETPNVNLGENQTICEGDSTYLTGPENATYAWSNSLTSQGIWVSTSNIYWLEASNNRCINTDSIEISTSNPEFSFAEDTIYTDLPYILYSESGYDSYLWSSGETEDNITITEPGWYTVNMWNEYGCEVSDSVYVDDLTGIDLHETFSFSVYPNPANKAIQIHASNYPCTVTIYTITGRKIKQIRIKADRQINLENFSLGTYLIKAKTINQTSQKQFVIL